VSGNIFQGYFNKANAATTAPHNITEILASKKYQQSFEAGNVVTESLVLAGNSLLNEFRNKISIVDLIKAVQLFRQYCHWRSGL